MIYRDEDGYPHRTDGPAVVGEEDGFREWRIHGLLHRPESEGPARIWGSGACEYWLNGSRHRVNGPAWEGHWEKMWYRFGKLHRDDDLPAVERTSGHREWWVNGVRHRDSGPAVIKPNGDEEDWRHGELVAVRERVKRPRNVN